MKKLDTTLFELDVVFETMSHATTWGILIDLKEIKKELISIKNELIDEAMSFDENVEEVTHIENQLVYLNKNIRTFENALMAHHTKCSEKRTLLNDLITIWLN
jgi:hypothetical protein